MAFFQGPAFAILLCGLLWRRATGIAAFVGFVVGVLFSITLFALSPGWAVGLVLLCVTPGGAFSNLFTYLSRGNTALSVSLTLVASLACIATVPILLKIFASGLLPVDFAFPAGPIIGKVALYLLLPLAIGLLSVNEGYVGIDGRDEDDLLLPPIPDEGVIHRGHLHFGDSRIIFPKFLVEPPFFDHIRSQ